MGLEMVKKIPKNVKVKLESEIIDDYYTKRACDSQDLDIKKKSRHILEVQNIAPESDWSIGVIFGSSGSGKTSLAKKLFGANCFQTALNLEKPIISQFGDSMNFEDRAKLLNGIGLNSVPCWVRQAKTLSNGQRARAEASLLISDQSKNLVCIDEWTSVVDRPVAKVMSHCLQKFARKQKKKIILVTCHRDVIEWLKADWMIDCNTEKFINRSELKQGFFLSQKQNLNSTSEGSTEKVGSILASIII